MQVPGMADFTFTESVVLVTGGTGGIGMAIAKAFAASGAKVIAAGLPQNGPELHSIRVENLQVTDEASIEELFTRIPQLHILVNAAGIIRRDAEFSLDQFQEVIDVNLTGVMRMCMAARPLLLRTRGCVINLASMYSFFGAGRAPAYGASKGAVAQLTRSLAVAWAPDHIRVNAIAPGWVETPLTQALRDDPSRTAPIVARTPMGRWATPEDIAGPALFLASDLARFITGAVLPVDGGYSCS